MKDLTDITILLDRSGSMEAIREATITGLNEFLQGQKPVPGDACLTLVTFDVGHKVERKAVAVKSCPEFTAADLVPRGSTALMDALGDVMKETGERFAKMAESDRPDKVLFVIVTDGLENASRRYSGPQIRELITHQDEVYKWEFVYLGANQDAFSIANNIGIAQSNTFQYHATASGVRTMFDKVSAGARKYRATGSKKDYFATDEAKPSE